MDMRDRIFSVVAPCMQNFHQSVILHDSFKFIKIVLSYIVLSCNFIAVVHLENLGCKNYFFLEKDGLKCIGKERSQL